MVCPKTMRFANFENQYNNIGIYIYIHGFSYLAFPIESMLVPRPISLDAPSTHRNRFKMVDV